MTLVIVVDEESAEETMAVARKATREHPSRVLGLIIGQARGTAKVNAQVGVGRNWGGEAAVIRLRGEVVKHAESVVLPLLLPDSPVVVWWAQKAPTDPAADPLGALATRRITDIGLGRSRRRALLAQCESYAPGNTDLAWTRLTLWRALLAAALDQYPEKVVGASISAERGHPSADLLHAWLTDRLGVDVELKASDGPAITEVRMDLRRGPIIVSRPDGRNAVLTAPGRPDRAAALRIRELPELIAEELRHLDADDVYAATLRRLSQMAQS